MVRLPLHMTNGRELENRFLAEVGVPRQEFYRFLRDDVARLLRLLTDESGTSAEHRALASRALAYLIQPHEVLPDESPLGHVDDYIILQCALDEICPDQLSGPAPEGLLNIFSHAASCARGRARSAVVRRQGWH